MKLNPFHALIISMTFSIICTIAVLIHIDLRLNSGYVKENNISTVDSTKKVEKLIDTLKQNN